ncbi:DUF1240 domain-containing protein [Pectobacterium araliae]
MVKINRRFFFLYSTLIFLLSCWGAWFSLSGYLNFFMLSDVVLFSWKLGMIIFIIPIVFQLSCFGFLSAIKNKPVKMNKKISNILIFIAVSGAVISLFFSFYVSYRLDALGYETCPKTSWMAPNKYVKDISLCKD